MMLTQMAGKQTVYNLLEYWTPVIKSRDKLNKLNEEYKDIIKNYIDKDALHEENLKNDDEIDPLTINNNVNSENMSDA